MLPNLAEIELGKQLLRKQEERLVEGMTLLRQHSHDSKDMEALLQPCRNSATLQNVSEGQRTRGSIQHAEAKFQIKYGCSRLPSALAMMLYKTYQKSCERKASFT